MSIFKVFEVQRIEQLKFGERSPVLVVQRQLFQRNRSAMFFLGGLWLPPHEFCAPHSISLFFCGFSSVSLNFGRLAYLGLIFCLLFKIKAS